MDVRIYISPTKWQVCSSGVFSQLAHPKPPRTGSLTHVQHKKGSISFPVAFGECYSSREVLNYLPLNSPLPMLHQIAAEILFRRHSWRMKGKEAGVGIPGRTVTVTADHAEGNLLFFVCYLQISSAYTQSKATLKPSLGLEAVLFHCLISQTVKVQSCERAGVATA